MEKIFIMLSLLSNSWRWWPWLLSAIYFFCWPAGGQAVSFKIGVSSNKPVVVKDDLATLDAERINRLYAVPADHRFQRRKTPIVVPHLEVRYAAPEGGEGSLLLTIDRHLQQLQQDKDSIYCQSLDKWFGVTPAYSLPRWLWAGLLGVTLLFAVLFLFVVLLRLQVRKRTAVLQNEIAVRKSAEEDLLKSGERFCNFIEQATDAIMLIELGGRIINVNKQACTSLGYSARELLKMTIADINPLFVKDNSNVQKLLTDKRSMIIESRHRRKDGSTFPVESNICLLESDKKPLILTLVRDISDRKEAEKKLLEAFDIINRSSSVAFLWKNEEGWPVEFVSSSVERLFGYSVEDFISGRITYAQVVHPDDLSRVAAEVESAVANGGQENFRHEPYRIITRENKTRWIDCQTRLKRDESGAVTHFQGVLIDVTQQQQTLQALRESEARYAALFCNNHTMILLVDPETADIIDANPAACSYYGYSLQELLSMKISDINILSRAEIDAKIAEATAEKHNSFLFKHRLKSGEIRDVEVFSGPMVIENRTLLCSVIHDVTQRVQLEQELVRSKEQLIMSEKMTTIAGLAAGVAHEINTPLSAILQSIQVIQRGFSGEVAGNRELAARYGVDLEKVDRYVQAKEIDFFLDGIRNSATNAARIVDDLLKFSRPHKGDVLPVDLTKLLDSALSLARADYDLKKKYDIINVEIIREYDQDLPHVRCVPMEIEQVVFILLKNAVQAMAEDEEDDLKSHIIIRTSKTGNRVRFEVEDNGPGMGEEVRKHVIDPIFTTKEIGTGTGLGRSVAYGIVHDKHKGRIWVESEPGRGTKFVVELPVEHVA